MTSQFNLKYVLPILFNISIKILYSNICPRCNVTQFILSGNCSTCFGWYHHPSSGMQRTVSTASGICHTAIEAGSSNGVTNTRCCRDSFMRSWWWVEVPPETCRGWIAAGSSNGVTNTRCCRYSFMRSWWWVKVPPETCRAVSR